MMDTLRLYTHNQTGLEVYFLESTGELLYPRGTVAAILGITVPEVDKIITFLGLEVKVFILADDLRHIILAYHPSGDKQRAKKYEIIKDLMHLGTREYAYKIGGI